MSVVAKDSLSQIPVEKATLCRSAHWREIGYAYDNVASFLSSTQPCVLSAYAARIHLGIRKQSFTLCLGVNNKSDSAMKAHAWIIVDDTIMTGRKGWHEDFVRVAGFGPN